MPENVPKPMTPSVFTPFGGEFDQLFNRMVRAWSFGMLEPAANGKPRALRAFDDAPKVEVQENGKTYDVEVMLESSLLKIQGCVLFICQTKVWTRKG